MILASNASPRQSVPRATTTPSRTSTPRASSSPCSSRTCSSQLGCASAAEVTLIRSWSQAKSQLNAAVIFNTAAYLNLYTVGGSIPHLIYDLFQHRSISAAAKSQIKIYQVNPLSTGLTPGNGGRTGSMLCEVPNSCPPTGRTARPSEISTAGSS